MVDTTCLRAESIEDLSYYNVFIVVQSCGMKHAGGAVGQKNRHVSANYTLFLEEEYNA